MSSVSSASTSIDGLISGLNTTDIITKLMQLEKAPQDALKTQLALLNQRIAAYTSINNKVSAVGDAATALASKTSWNLWQATSTTPTAATATATTAANGGSLTFTVDRMASAGSLVSSGTVSSTTATVASGSLLLAKGGTSY